METNEIIDWLHTIEGNLPTVFIILGSIAAFAFITLATLKLFDLRRIISQPLTLIELTPPARSEKSAEATRQLFTVLHGMRESRSFGDKLLRKKIVFTLEIISTRKEGIRYVMCIPSGAASSFKHTISSYLPEAKIKILDEYLPPKSDLLKARTLAFRQSGHFAYPLITDSTLEVSDPVAYINGAMTQLKANEMILFQMIISPVNVREAGTIQNRLIHNEALLTQLGKKVTPFNKFFSLFGDFLFGILETISSITDGSDYGSSHTASQKAAVRRQEIASKIKPARTLSSIEQELALAVNSKLQQPLFSVDVRALVLMNDSEHTKQRISGLRNALDAFRAPKYQSLVARFSFPLKLRGRLRINNISHRLPSFFQANTSILSASEVAGIYHFPHNESAKTENVVKSLSKTLSAPLSLKNGTQVDVMLGQNNHLGLSTPIGLTAAERARHIYIIGGTGNGKTTMLQYAIVQDIQNGKGVAVVDPHGDMAETLLRHIPEDRIKDVIYFNPDDFTYPIGMNLLELPTGLEGDDLFREKDRVTESVVSIFRKIFSEDDSGGHRIEYILRNCIQTALTVENATIFTIYDLLNDIKYRNTVLTNVKNKNLKNFWKNELGKAGDMQKVKMAAGITTKIGRFLFSESAKRVLEQPKSTIDFDDIINSGKILICNFSKGLIGEDTSELFGIAVLAKLQLAAYRRTSIQESERKPFFVYVDEFQNFATPSFVQMLSESRKYKLMLTMAEQSTSQQDQQMVSNILANVGTVVCFRTGNPADEKLLLPLFAPYVSEGEIANLPSYNFYMRIAAVVAQEPFSGETIVLQDNANQVRVKKIITNSRNRYANEFNQQTISNPPLVEKVSQKILNKKPLTKPKIE